MRVMVAFAGRTIVAISIASETVPTRPLSRACSTDDRTLSPSGRSLRTTTSAPVIARASRVSPSRTL